MAWTVNFVTSTCMTEVLTDLFDFDVCVKCSNDLILKGRKLSGMLSDCPDIERIKRTLKTLYKEHDEIGDAVYKIRKLAGDYKIPKDACNTFVLTFKKLNEFEDDLHKHVHLENNILFPKAGRL